MALKRNFGLAVGSNDGPHVGINHDDDEPPVKRRLSSVPRTPFSERSSLPVAQTPFTGTPYPSRPLDSPTNPLGRRRLQNLTHTLPPPTSFRKHLPLRFQFVRPGVSPRMGGIYRVVQVPLSYTFVHLRRLIAFLYGGGIGEELEDRHLFEVKKKMMMHAITYKPGQIKHGFTAVKLSTARDPCRYKPEGDENTVDDDSMQGEDKTVPSQVISDSEESGDEEPSWKWELEEEFTLGHVWSKGIDLSAGIIYHHDETTAVHITINTTSLPRRHGHSNIPYVFSARGRVRIYPNTFLPLPKPIFSVPIRKLFMTSFRDPDWSTSTKVGERATENEDEGTDNAEEEKVAGGEDFVDDNGDSGLEVGDARLSGFLRDEPESNGNDGSTTTDEEEEEEEEEEHDDPSIFLDVKKFNAPHAFPAYLRFVHQHGQRRQCPLSDESDDEDEDDLFHLRSTPALVHTNSSPASSPIASSSTVFSSSPFVSPERCKTIPYDPYLASFSTLTSLSSATYTPVPAHASWQIRRFERVRRRMDKCKKKAWMSSEDEAEDIVGQPAGDAQGQKLADARGDSRPTTQDGLNDEKSIPPLPLWEEPQMKMDDMSNPFVDELEV